MPPIAPRAFAFSAVLLAAFAALPPARSQERGTPGANKNSRPIDAVLAVVNGRTITEGDLRFLMLRQRVPENLQKLVRRRLLERLVERELMRSYLAERAAEPDAAELDRQAERVRALIRKTGRDPENALEQIGYSEQDLREAITVPLAWRKHFRRTVTGEQLREYFRERRAELDGTEVRARQVFLKVAPDESAETAVEKLSGIRAKIVEGSLEFAEAARRYSEAPTAKKGGDVGFFAYRGKMPEPVARAAFALKPGEVSQPVRSRFGVHLLLVTDRRPGQLSLEDARPIVYRRLSTRMWRRITAELRKEATIEWKVDRAPTDD